MKININWKLRLKNKVTLLTLLTTIAGFVYQLFGILGIVPSIAESEVENLIGLFVNFLAIVGVVVDPTTSGVSDSTRAMTYEKPRKEI